MVRVYGLRISSARLKITNQQAGVDSRPGNLYLSSVTRLVDLLIEFLQSEHQRGKRHVFLEDEVRNTLRELKLRLKKNHTTPAPAAPAPTPVAIAPTPPLPRSEVVVQGDDKTARLASIRRQTENWAPARSLGTLRETMVFSAGNPDARIMLVGEGPGYNEEREGKPFVGEAGDKLAAILKAMGTSREEVYISNLMKFRPASPGQTINNRKPSREELECCLPLLLAEISVVTPDIIIVLGSTAAEGLLGIGGPLEKLRGKWHVISGIPARVTFHPSQLLLGGNSNKAKEALWDDMLEVMEKLSMPISERQRGFFRKRP